MHAFRPVAASSPPRQFIFPSIRLMSGLEAAQNALHLDKKMYAEIVAEHSG